MPYVYINKKNLKQVLTFEENICDFPMFAKEFVKFSDPKGLHIMQIKHIDGYEISHRLLPAETEKDSGVIVTFHVYHNEDNDKISADDDGKEGTEQIAVVTAGFESFSYVNPFINKLLLKWGAYIKDRHFIAKLYETIPEYLSDTVQFDLNLLTSNKGSDTSLMGELITRACTLFGIMSVPSDWIAPPVICKREVLRMISEEVPSRDEFENGLLSETDAEEGIARVLKLITVTR